MLLNIQAYVAIKAKGADKKEVRQAVEFSRGVRKRMGMGGEGKWLGGRGKEELREEWEREREGVDTLLEWCGRSVRFGVAKGGLEAPEYD